MTHTVYFAQHGLAVDKTDDPERPLSAAGINQSNIIAKALHDSTTPITRVFHSGRLRALQTAEIYSRAIKHSSTSAVDGLSPGDDVTLLAQNLNINHALYVGHLPHLEKLVAYLVTGNEKSNIIRFQNSAVLCLEKSQNHYQLRWFLTPELL
jgi:phosphohistidine phosphatase